VSLPYSIYVSQQLSGCRLHTASWLLKTRVGLAVTYSEHTAFCLGSHAILQEMEQESFLVNTLRMGVFSSIFIIDH
jgi:hypothetical protein